MRFSLLLELARRDFSERYAGSVLGMLWALLLPLVMIFIYTVIFSRVMGAKLPGIGSTYSYGVYLIAGVVPWTAFANTVSRSCTAFVDKKHLISKISISLPSFPFYIVLSETFSFMITMVLYMIFLLVIGIPMTWSLLWAPAVFAVQQIFAYALGLLLATLTVFLRDLREIVGIVIQLWFWFTPIVYTANIIPDAFKSLLHLNPAYIFVGAFQNIFFHSVPPDFKSLIVLTILGHVLLLVGYLLFKKLERDVRDFL